MESRLFCLQTQVSTVLVLLRYQSAIDIAGSRSKAHPTPTHKKMIPAASSCEYRCTFVLCLIDRPKAHNFFGTTHIWHSPT
jgi:hypothetical protein